MLLLLKKIEGFREGLFKSKGGMSLSILVHSVEQLQKAIKKFDIKTIPLEQKIITLLEENPKNSLALAVPTLHQSTQKALKDKVITLLTANRINYLTSKILTSPNLEDIENIYHLKKVHFELKPKKWKQILGCLLILSAIALFIGTMFINPFLTLGIFIFITGLLALGCGAIHFNDGREKEIRFELNSFFEEAINNININDSLQCEAFGEDENFVTEPHVSGIL